LIKKVAKNQADGKAFCRTGQPFKSWLHKATGRTGLPPLFSPKLFHRRGNHKNFLAFK